MTDKKFTRGELIKKGIESRITANREIELEKQREMLEDLINEEEKRVYGEAVNSSVGSPTPSFDITLDWVPLDEIKTEYEKEGFKFELKHSDMHILLAD